MNELRDRVIAIGEAKLTTLTELCYQTSICRKDREALAKSVMEEILSITELAVVDREVELPSIYYEKTGHRLNASEMLAFMLELGWVKEVKDG